MKPDLFQAILSFIALQALTPNATAEKFDLTRQAVLKHIKVLHECDPIKLEYSGREIYCYFTPKKMQELDNWLALFRKIRETRFNQLDHLLSGIKKTKK